LLAAGAATVEEVLRRQPVVNGAADIAGVDRALIETFSRRRAAIVELLAARGESSAAAAQTATLATRQAKGERASETELRGEWGRRAAAAGVRPRWPATLTGQAVWHRPDLNGLYRTLVVDEQLTTTSSTFTRRDVLQQLAGLLPAGAPVGYLEQAADAVIAHDPDQLFPLGHDTGPAHRLGRHPPHRRATRPGRPERTPLHHPRVAAHRTAGHQPQSGPS
jgi:hypothetical protein